jgi:hypothetical protein
VATAWVALESGPPSLLTRSAGRRSARLIGTVNDPAGYDDSKRAEVRRSDHNGAGVEGDTGRVDGEPGATMCLPGEQGLAGPGPRRLAAPDNDARSLAGRGSRPAGSLSLSGRTRHRSPAYPVGARRDLQGKPGWAA